MPRPSRARRIFKWTGVGLSAGILAVWVVSLWCDIQWRATPHLLVELSSGECGTIHSKVDLSQLTPTFHVQTGLVWHEFKTNDLVPPWGVHSERRPDYQGPWVNYVWVALWLPLLLTAIPTAWLWHRDRRRIRPGCCLRCGYDLTGNTSGVCPECGDKVHPPVVLADSECGEKMTPVSQAPSRQGRV